jgi:hypothetical protein
MRIREEPAAGNYNYRDFSSLREAQVKMTAMDYIRENTCNGKSNSGLVAKISSREYSVCLSLRDGVI